MNYYNFFKGSKIMDRLFILLNFKLKIIKFYQETLKARIIKVEVIGNFSKKKEFILKIFKSKRFVFY